MCRFFSVMQSDLTRLFDPYRYTVCKVLVDTGDDRKEPDMGHTLQQSALNVVFVNTV